MDGRTTYRKYPQAIFMIGFLFALLIHPLYTSANETAVMTLSLTLHQMNESNRDTDGDGLDDIWEIRLFGNLDTVDRTSDFDLDGFNDYAEYIAGTDPKDDASALQIAHIKVLPNGLLQIVWSSTTSTEPSPRLYDIYVANSIQDLITNKTLLGQNIPSGGDTTILNNVPGGSAQKYYSIDVKLDD